MFLIFPLRCPKTPIFTAITPPRKHTVYTAAIRWSPDGIFRMLTFTLHFPAYRRQGVAKEPQDCRFC